MISDQKTIFALSSGHLPSGIAVVRVSGPLASNVLRDIAGTGPSPRKATRVRFVAPGGEPIDDGLVLWFPAPHSATGEDLAEFHCHGGRAVVAALFAAFNTLGGLSPAEPGEFTRRAFENGKIDLVAAEGLDDLIHSDTERQRRQAFRQLSGLLGDRARDWRQAIIDASALIEAGIDFSDEGDVAHDALASARDAIASLRSEIAQVLARAGRSERLRDGLIVAITGPPNAGKSTLFNALSGRDVAIVSPYAGTTRDALEVQLDLGGYPITLVDTAGLREAHDPVEQEGIRRAAARAADADLVLWLTDDDAVPRIGGSAPVWRVKTKADLAWAHGEADFLTSATSGQGLTELTKAIVEFAATLFPGEGALITRARHRDLLERACVALGRALDEAEPELIAEELRSATASLGRLLGRVDVEDVLGSIFSRFCIGK